MSIYFHEEDLAENVRFADGPIAVDTEAMGLIPGRDRLCVVQRFLRLLGQAIRVH